MSNETTLAGMPTKTRNEILWGRKGLPAEFYGPELIAEALSTVLQKMDLSTMDGFVHFNEAFRGHHFGLDNIVIEAVADCISPPRWFNPDGVNLNLLGLELVWGIGTFGTEYGLVWRSLDEVPEDFVPQDWLEKAAWEQMVRENEADRFSVHDQMPAWQISHMRTKRVFLTQSGRMFVVEVEWKAGKLAPQVYKPNRFQVTKVTFISLYGAWQKKDTLEFLSDHGPRAGVAVLSGLQLALQSSNYRLREALKTNEKAEKKVLELLARVSR